MPDNLPRRAPQTQKELENEIADSLARGVATGELVPREMAQPESPPPVTAVTTPETAGYKPPLSAGPHGMPTVAAPSADPREQPAPWTGTAPTERPKPVAAPPAAATVSAPDRRPWDMLASGDRSTTRRTDIAPPPQASGRNDWATGLALAADMFLNKGRNAGQFIGQMSQPSDTAYENYQRKMQHEKDLSGIQAEQARANKPFGVDPRTLDLRERQLALRERGLGTTESREARLLEQQQQRMLPDSSLAKSVRGYLKSTGVDTTALNDLSVDAMRSASPALKHAIDHAFADQIGDDKADQAGKVAAATEGSKIRVAGGISDATQKNKIALVQEQLKGREADREANWSIKNAERGEDFAKWYSTQAEKDLGIARLMDEVGASPGDAVPQSVFERLSRMFSSQGLSSITAQGIDAERMKPWQAKKMILELWGRQQSGAAISNTENANFASQTGSNPYATEAEVNAAFDVMEDTLTTWLRSKAAARPGDARQVMRAGGIDDARWLGAEQKDAPLPSAHKPKPRATTAQAEAGESDEQQPKTIGMRNGKPVRAIKKLSGNRGRVVFYADGSRELVQ